MNCPTDNSTLRRRLRRTVVGITLSIASSALALPQASAHASDCGCESGSCDSFSCECETHRQSKSLPHFDMRKTPIYKTLDLLAGGIEKVLRLDEDSQSGCDDSPSCDDACDSAMLMELSAPLPTIPMPAPSTRHMHSHPVSPPIASPADRVIRPTPIRQSMPRVPAPVMPSNPNAQSPTLVPAPVEPAIQDAPSLDYVAPMESPSTGPLRRISSPGAEAQSESQRDIAPRLPSPIIDRNRERLEDVPLPAEREELVDPFLDDPFQSTPLGREKPGNDNVGSGLRPVHYQRSSHVQRPSQSTSRTPSHPTSSRSATKHRTSRNPKSNRGGMFR